MSNTLPNECEQFRADIAAHALGEAALSPEARAHVDSCASCQRELRQDRRVAQALLISAPDVSPSPALRARLLAAAEADIRPPRRELRRRGMPGWATWGLVAAALVLLLVWNVALQGQVGQQRAELSASRANWQTMTRLLNADNLEWYLLSGQQGRGHFWAAPDQAAACLVVEGLPPLPAGQVYQIWLERGQDVTSGGLLTVTDGSGWKLIRDENASKYTFVRVTVEPAAGSAAPTGKAVLQGMLVQAFAPSQDERQRAALIVSGNS